jgi:hypothetical protein
MQDAFQDWHGFCKRNNLYKEALAFYESFINTPPIPETSNIDFGCVEKQAAIKSIQSKHNAMIRCLVKTLESDKDWTKQGIDYKQILDKANLILSQEIKK